MILDAPITCASQAVKRRAAAGALLGTAVGDAIGLPREGLGAGRAQRLFGPAPLRHRFIFGRGMTSDDTEHTCMVAQALLASGGDPARFSRSLAWRLRGWILGLPAGVGWATLRAIVKLWLGFPACRGRWMPGSGVWSAGNGPAMRSAIIGVWCGDRIDAMLRLVQASTEITHTDPRARHGATAVALAAAYAAGLGGQAIDAQSFLSMLERTMHEQEFSQAIAPIRELLANGAPPAEYAAALGLTRGVGGYVYHTVPVALYCWLRHPDDFRAAVESAVLLGGDTDTVGAIVGALAGATLGPDAIPREWLRLLEWPRSVDWMRRLAERLVEPTAAGPLPLFWPALLARNGVFLILVLLHALRRLLPPYSNRPMEFP
jgi:ADP-ribosylglycohydrolase